MVPFIIISKGYFPVHNIRVPSPTILKSYSACTLFSPFQCKLIPRIFLEVFIFSKYAYHILMLSSTLSSSSPRCIIILLTPVTPKSLILFVHVLSMFCISVHISVVSRLLMTATSLGLIFQSPLQFCSMKLPLLWFAFIFSNYGTFPTLKLHFFPLPILIYLQHLLHSH